MTKQAGIVADGAMAYLAALEAQAVTKLKELEERLAHENDEKNRTNIASEMKRVRAELAEKRRRASFSLF